MPSVQGSAMKSVEVFVFFFFFSKEIIEACTWLPVFNMEKVIWHGQSLRTNECRKFSCDFPNPQVIKPISAKNLVLKRITHFTSFSVLKAYFSRFFKWDMLVCLRNTIPLGPKQDYDLGVKGNHPSLLLSLHHHISGHVPNTLRSSHLSPWHEKR